LQADLLEAQLERPGELAAELFHKQCRFHRISLSFSGPAYVAKIAAPTIKTIPLSNQSMPPELLLRRCGDERP
jgi:hypothetical protein